MRPATLDAPRALQSLTMPIPGDGDATRHRILAELLRRERTGEPSPNWTELADAAKVRETATRFHCAKLRDAGLLDYRDRHTRTIRLTPAGRKLAQG